MRLHFALNINGDHGVTLRQLSQSVKALFTRSLNSHGGHELFADGGCFYSQIKPAETNVSSFKSALQDCCTFRTR